MSETSIPERGAAPPQSWRGYLAVMGPGLAMAATGVGAGDMVASTVSGARFGYAVIWAALLGAGVKLLLSEGVARWQLATGTTVLEGWAQRLGPWARGYFIAYLVFWTFFVAAAQMSACGLAAHALAPGLSVPAWGILHALVAAAVVVVGGYAPFEQLMKVFIGLMFVTLVGCALTVATPWSTGARLVAEAAVPAGSAPYVLGIIGGVGGSLTLLSYGYWMRERRWEGAAWLRTVRLDLWVSYVLVGIFGVAVVVMAAEALHAQGVAVEGPKGVLTMAELLGTRLGGWGRRLFLVGFWGAVATSMLGVWQSVPYLFCDFVGLMKRLPPDEHAALLAPTSRPYRGYLAAMVVLPMALLFADKPVAIVVVYSVIGALFMPFLAGTLLYMNGRRDWVGDLRNSGLVAGLLVLTLVLFVYLAGSELLEAAASLR